MKKKIKQEQIQILSNMTFPQYLEGIKLTFLNFKKLYASSKVLSYFRMFGPANSLAVLSAEEALKCLMLIIKMLGFFPEDQSLQKVFTSHSVKHEFGWWFGLLHDTFELSGISFEKYESFTSEQKSNMARRYYSANIAVIKNRTDHSENDWWKNANEKKNTGLYVGLDGKPWSTPDQITQSDLNKSFKEVSRVLKELKMYMKTFDKFKNVEALEEFINGMKVKTENIKKTINPGQVENSKLKGIK